ncbi:MAG: cobyrinate a,c-diamide synthase [Clostridiales bacterium]|nr:cobyrinate a,c-diamide synthase [Clostridiales bacterium]
MKIKRVMIAAPKSSSGKTVVTCALLKALKDMGRNVVSYKCGPDYIDPMFHEKVINVPAENLDTFFTDEETTMKLFQNSAKGADFAVLEGVMGLYDGLGGVREEGSSYHLAKVTKTPIVLVVDSKGMGRSVISLIAGFLDYDDKHLIKGVIFNRISKGYYEILKPLIEKELQIKVIGFLPENDKLHIESRHLGLVLPNEASGVADSVNAKDLISEKLHAASEFFALNVSIEGIEKIAEDAESIENAEYCEEAEASEQQNNMLCEKMTNVSEICRTEQGKKPYTAADTPVIAVAKDEAFCFYYKDNIRLLEKYGAKISYFSPIRDEELPQGCHALLIGGGYPELYAGKLSANTKMLTTVKCAAENKMPIVVECGGFMYLHSCLKDQAGICYNMAGVVPATCFYTGKSVRFGYIELKEKRSYFLPEGDRIKGHEFHYYDSTCNGEDAMARKPVTEKEYSCIIENETQWLGFPHLYYPSNPAFAKAFVDKARLWRI